MSALNSVNRRLSVVMGAVAVEATRKPRASKKAAEPAGFSAMEGDKLNATRLKNWGKLDRAEQIEYLKAHPKSIFHKAPLKKEDQQPAPAQPESAPSGEAPAAAPAPAPELTTDAETGLPRREATPEDQAEMKQGVADLSAEGATAPGSEVREQAAAIVEEQAAKLIQDNVGPEIQQQIKDFIGPPKQADAPNSNSAPATPETAPTPAPENQAPDAAPAPADPNSNPSPAPAPAPQPGPEDRVPDDVQEDDDDDFDERPGRRRRGGGSGLGKNLAILAGCLAVAALIGGGAFMIDPTLGILAGRKILDHFQSAYQFSHETLSSVEAGDADAISQFTAAIADWVRRGEFGDDLLPALQRQYG